MTGINFMMGGRQLTYEQAGHVMSVFLAEDLGMHPSRVVVVIHDVSENDETEYASTLYHVEIDGTAELAPALSAAVGAFLSQYHSGTVREVPKA